MAYVFAENLVDLKNHYADALGELVDIEAIVDKWDYQLRQDMKDIWKGKDYDKFVEEFAEDLEGNRKHIVEMRALISALGRVEREYDTMEDEIVGLNIVRA